jgi:heptosyltransferase-2
MSRRALLLKFGAIGDVIMVIPAAQALHRAGYTIDWVCGSQVLGLLECYPWINPIVADDRAILTGGIAAKARALLALWRKITPQRYDLVATLYYDARYRVLTLPVRAPRKLRLSTTDRSYRILPGRHHSDEFLRILLDRPDGVQPAETQPVRADRLPISPLAPTPGCVRVVLAPAGARNMMAEATLRRWPAERYVDLARDLIAAGIEVVLIGGPDDAWVQPLFAELPVVDCIGRYSLVETIALLNTAELLVTHDTGPLHLGGLSSASLVAIFGPTDPHMFLPQRAGTVALWGGEGFACRPCYDGRNFAACPSNDCVREVTVAMVLDEIMNMLADRQRGTLAAPRIIARASTTKSQTLVNLEGMNG